MTLIYQIQKLRYNFTKSKFEDFDFNTALKYCKLIYKDMPNFQKEVLSKMENNSDLQLLKIELESNFENAIPLTEKEILNIKNQEIIDFAMLRLQNYLISIPQTNPIKHNFFDKYIQKIKNYLEEEPSTVSQPYSGSKLVKNKTPFYIKSINEYRIKEQEEYVHFKLNNTNKLSLNESIKYLVCSYLSIKEIELNKGLQFLDAAHNQIKNIKLNETLQELNIASNNLEQIELNECLEKANLSNNPLQQIKITKNLKSISLSHPENKKITIDNSTGNQNVIVNYYLN